jgi:AraC-like DNA-binding protein
MPCIRTLEFDDPASCRNAFINSEFEAFPKVSGRFLFKLTQIGMNRLWVARYSLSLPQVNVFSITPERTVIGFLTEPGSSVRYRGTNVLPTDIIINRADEAHQQIDASLHGGTMSLPTDELNAAIEAVIGRDFMQKLAKPIVRPSPALISRLLKLHKEVGQLANMAPEVIELPEVCRALEEQLIHLMVRCLAECAGIENTVGGSRHNAIIAKFEDYLAAHSDQPLYLTKICAGIGVTERTLRVACVEHLGIGPIRYLSLRRMHLVRRALLGADASKTNVTRIVTDHGFWQLGRFSTAYRGLFKELPSETLRRPVVQPTMHLNRPSSFPVNVIAGHLN